VTQWLVGLQTPEDISVGKDCEILVCFIKKASQGDSTSKFEVAFSNAFVEFQDSNMLDTC
jgi:hypothetical protein